MTKLIRALICLAAIFSANSAFAANVSQAELKRLQDRIATLEEKMLQKEESQKPQDSDVILSLRPGPNFKTRDGKNSFAIDGRLMIDAGAVTSDKTSTLKNSMEIRRLWLGIGGTVNKDWSYRGIVGFETNNAAIQDAFIAYNGVKNTSILAGNFFENNGIDIETQNLIGTFMERAAGITTFRLLRRTGVSVDPHGDNWGAKFGIFGSSPSNSNAGNNNKGQGFSTRVYIAPINDSKAAHYLHLGFNNTYRTPDSATKTVRFNSTGDSNVIGGVYLVDTGSISNVNSYYQNMAEFRYQKGSLALTGEYIKTTLNRGSAADLQFSGGYFMASYFLTGERYGYDIARGTPSAPIINHGAWEIAGRYSMVDLNNKTISGGKLDSYDLGLNYHLNSSIKFMGNYIMSHLDSTSLVQKQNPQYLMLRAQVSF